MPVKRLIANCTGINNRINPLRLRQYDEETGLSDLAVGVNIDIDASGQIASRNGQVAVKTDYPYHSLFYDSGECFVVADRESDAALYVISDSLDLTCIRAGLTKGARMSYAQVGDMTFFGNGYENGYVRNSTAYAWPALEDRNGTLKHVVSAPVGSHIAYHNGRMWVAVDSVIYCSEVYKLGTFRVSARGFPFPTAIRMIRPVRSGVFVSDCMRTVFLADADTFETMVYLEKSPYPAHEWSDNCRLVDLSETSLQLPGLSAVWSSDMGLCVGTQDGDILEVSRKKLLSPTGEAGATVVSEGISINSVF